MLGAFFQFSMKKAIPLKENGNNFEIKINKCNLLWWSIWGRTRNTPKSFPHLSYFLLHKTLANSQSRERMKIIFFRKGQLKWNQQVVYTVCVCVKWKPHESHRNKGRVYILCFQNLLIPHKRKKNKSLKMWTRDWAISFLNFIKLKISCFVYNFRGKYDEVTRMFNRPYRNVADVSCSTAPHSTGYYSTATENP